MLATQQIKNVFKLLILLGNNSVIINNFKERGKNTRKLNKTVKYNVNEIYIKLFFSKYLFNFKYKNNSE